MQRGSGCAFLFRALWYRSFHLPLESPIVCFARPPCARFCTLDFVAASGRAFPYFSPTGVSEEECDRYLRSLPIPPRVQAALPLLWRPLTEDLVREALKKMRRCSSPGNDTVPAAVYQCMGPLFVPRMHAVIKRSLDRAAAPEGWSTTILKCIPKSITSETAAEQRPLALLNSSIKWLTTVFLLQLSDVFQQVTPAAHKGFLPGRHMVEHTIAAVAFWNQSSVCILVAVDFAKAYDSIQHNFASAVLRYLGVRGQYVVVLVALMCSPLVIEVCSEVQPDVVVRPGSEVQHGDPLSPALFSVLTLALIYAIQRLHCQVEVLLYGDDILSMVTCSGSRARADVRAVMYELSVYGYFSGLRTNHQKTYALVKDSAGRAPKTFAGIEVRKSLRYLGVQLGHLTVEHAYGTVMAKMLLRARYISTLPLTLGEKASVLEIWAAPCVYLTAKVYYPSPSVVQQLNAIQSVALGLNSWGLTRGILAKPAAMGGIALPPLGSYALWIHSQGFVQHVRGTTPGGVRSVDQFEDWARSVRMVLTPDMPPYIRLAPRTRQPPGHLGTSCII